jgi:hypothetical protein
MAWPWRVPSWRTTVFVMVSVIEGSGAARGRGAAAGGRVVAAGVAEGLLGLVLAPRLRQHLLGQRRLPRRRIGAGGEDLVGGVAVEGRVVAPGDRRGGEALGAFLLRDRPHARGGRADQRALDHARHALVLQERGHRLAGADLADRGLGVEGGVGAEGLGGGAQRLGLARGIGAQRVLDAVAELGEHVGRHVVGVLGDEPDADALGADQPHHLHHLVDQRLRRVGEQQMRLVEEEDELRLLRIADLGQFLEELRQEPEQEHRVEPRRVHQPVGHQHVDPAPPAVGGDHVGKRERGLAEEAGRALVLERQELALDRAERFGATLP